MSHWDVLRTFWWTIDHLPAVRSQSWQGSSPWRCYEAQWNGCGLCFFCMPGVDDGKAGDLDCWDCFKAFGNSTLGPKWQTTITSGEEQGAAERWWAEAYGLHQEVPCCTHGLNLATSCNFLPVFEILWSRKSGKPLQFPPVAEWQILHPSWFHHESSKLHQTTWHSFIVIDFIHFIIIHGKFIHQNFIKFINWHHPTSHLEVWHQWPKSPKWRSSSQDAAHYVKSQVPWWLPTSMEDSSSKFSGQWCWRTFLAEKLKKRPASSECYDIWVFICFQRFIERSAFRISSGFAVLTKTHRFC